MRWFQISPTSYCRFVLATLRRGGSALAVGALAVASCGIAGASASRIANPDRRVLADQSTTRVLTLVYKGSGMGKIVQHVDNRPGHAGAAYDDTYTKQVHWTISWRITIEDGLIVAVGEPTGTVGGTASADIRSRPGASCKGKVTGLVLGGRPYIPTTLEVVAMTKQYITVRLAAGSSSYGSLPLSWADVPTCPAAVFGAVSPIYTYSSAVVAWNKSVDPQFTIALFNNYRIRPDSFGKTWEFPPEAPQKSVIFRWSSRVAYAGF